MRRKPCGLQLRKDELRAFVAASRQRIVEAAACLVSRLLRLRRSPPYCRPGGDSSGVVTARGVPINVARRVGSPTGCARCFVFATRILLPGILGELLAAKSEHGLDRGFQRILYDQQRRPKRPSSILLLPSSNARSFSCVRSDANILCIQELLRGGRSQNSRAASPERLACVMTKVDTVQQGLFRPESLRARELAWQGRPALVTGNPLAHAISRRV